MADVYKGLTVKFRGDVTSLTKALSSINSASRVTASNLKQINTALKFNPTNTTLLAQKYNEVGRQISNTRLKLNEFQQAQKTLGSSRDTATNVEQWDKLERDIIKCRSQLKYYGQIQQEVAAQSSALGKIGTHLKNAGDKAAALGSTLTNTLTIGIAAAAYGSIKAATDIDTSLTSVKKTVDGTDEQYQQLKESAIEFSETNAVSASQILDIQALGAQLGFSIDELDEFSRVVSGLDIATNMDAETAATQMAQFANITKMSHDEISNYGSAIVGLGNNFSTTESDINDMAMRIAAAGTQVGMSQADILGLSTALSSMGVEAEAGGTAISTIMSQIDKDIATNSDNVQTWADAAGMSAADFAAAWESDPVSALEALLTGLEGATTEGSNMSVMLDELGISSLRQTDVMKRLAGNSQLLGEAVDEANSAWSSNTALTDEVDNRNQSLASKFEILKNKVIAVAEQFGGPLADALLSLVDSLEPVFSKISGVAQAFADMDEEGQRTVVTLLAFLAALGPMLKTLPGIGSGLSGMAGFFQKVGDAASKTSVKVEEEGNESEKTAKKTNVLKGALITAAAAAGTMVVAFAINKWAEYREHVQKVTKATDGLRDAQTNALGSFQSEAAQLDSVSTSSGKARDSIDELIDKQADLAESIQSSFADTNANVAVLEGYQQTIDTLANKSGLSADEQARLSLAVQGVNDACGTEYQVVDAANGVISDNTGEIQDNTAAIDDLIDAKQRSLQIDALNSAYVDLKQQQTSDAETLAAAEDRLATAKERAHDASLSDEERRAAAINVTTETQNVADAQAAYDSCTDSMGSYTDQMTILEMATQQGAGSVADMISQDQLLMSQLGNKGELLGFTNSLSAAGQTADTLSQEQLATLATNYDGTMTSIVSTLTSFGGDAATAATDAANQWASGLSEGTMASVNAAMQVTGMTLPEFWAAASDAGVSGDEAVTGFANNLAAGSTAASVAGSGVADRAANALRSGDAYGAGQDMGQGYADGIGSKIGAVIDNAVSLARAAINAVNAEQQSGSPSKVTRKSGKWFSQGYAGGIAEDAYLAARQSAAMVDGAIGATGLMASGGIGFTMSLPASAAVSNTTSSTKTTVNINGDLNNDAKILQLTQNYLEDLVTLGRM